MIGLGPNVSFNAAFLAVSGPDANEGGPGFVRPASQIPAGAAHSCALSDNATVRCWDAGANGRLGYGKATDTLLVGDWNGDNIDTFAVQRKEL